MRDRALVPAAVIAAIVCCGATALVLGVASGVALAAIGRFTAVTAVGLGIVVLIAWRLDRHRSSGSPDPADRAWGAEETSR
tara:strand:+ start:499 stop:741 length:243 start_codon:yes stop_codon:yes gene_type:complete